jgi:ubiquinone/menaquinone biosynthesis C-methylase UbiE
MQLSAIYERRFVESTGLEKRNRVWRTLCSSFFDTLIGSNQDVLDLACGYGEFINNVSAKSKTAIDLNPDAERHLSSGVRFVCCPALEPTLADETQDVVFASNFLEHLRDKNELVLLLAQVRRVLRNEGRFIVMGPNIKYAYKEYWDFFDHHLPLSHLSLVEGLEASSFRVVRTIPRFLPFTMVGKMPTFDWMIKLYLKIPLVWAILGKQFLIVAEKHN